MIAYSDRGKVVVWLKLGLNLWIGPPASQVGSKALWPRPCLLLR